MNLEGKYIIIDKKNYKQVIPFLYREGFSNFDKFYVESVTKYLNNNNILYVRMSGNNIYSYFNKVSIENYDFVDINKYLREEKLKHILK